jgi:uncharacterized protein
MGAESGRTVTSLAGLGARAAAAFIVVAVGSLLLLASGTEPSLAAPPERADAVLIAGSHRYYLQLATTPAQQALGLGGRTRMPADRGMLFVFHTSANECFWMKGMRFALDIIWLSPEDDVVSVEADLLPKYTSVYCSVAEDVVELNAGQARAAGIKVGRVVKLDVPAT